MAGKRNTNLHLAPPVDEEELIIKQRYRKSQQKKTVVIVVVLSLLIVAGTYVLLTFQKYGNVSTTKTYSNAGSDNNRYETFANGIIRYTSDGVVFLNKSNTVLWNQPYQIKNPVIETTGKSFAIADQGGTTIMVFTKDGLKGQIETSLTIEKIALSDQGIVSAILKDEKTPKIVSYDATGNILVEHDVDMNETGYPVGLAMSPKGNLLGVSYLSIQDNVLKDQVVFYNFGSVGQDKANHVVTSDEYRDAIMPSVYFMNDTTAMVVGENQFVIYSGGQIPEAKKTIDLKKEIKSAFHSDKYIGFVLKNTDSTMYDLCIYNTNGRKVMSTQFAGEYSNVEISGREVMLYEGSRACIYGLNGIQRFRGRLTMDVQKIVSVFGINKYLLINASETQVVHLVK